MVRVVERALQTCTINFLFSELKRITKDISEKPEIRFLYVTPEHASTEYFANILESLNKNDKLAYIAVDDGKIRNFNHQ